eukprot:1146173-Pelagomonas_calceolata.AAC.1
MAPLCKPVKVVLERCKQTKDEEHIILDCPSQDSTNLRAQFQHLFSSAPPSSASRLRDFMNQDDVLGLAKLARFASAKLPLQAGTAM